MGRNIRAIRKKQGKSVKEVADALGVSTQSWYKWERGAAIPALGHQEPIARVLGVEPEELRKGIGEAMSYPATLSPPWAALPDKNAEAMKITVVGLAECGLKGWYSPNVLPVTVLLPVHYEHPENLFAVMATGQSLVPEGVREGYILFCDRYVTPVKNDLVYIYTKDGRASVKRFSKLTDEWLVVEGWLPPDHNGKQSIYTDEIALHTVDFYANVIMIRRKG